MPSSPGADIGRAGRAARPALSSAVSRGVAAFGLWLTDELRPLAFQTLQWRCCKLKRVKPRALFVAQLFLKLGNGDLDRLHRVK